MSYCRFGWDGSDVYVYPDIDGRLECCGCILGNQWSYPTAEAMIEHLDRHIAAGHTVPPYVIPEILADKANGAIP